MAINEKRTFVFDTVVVNLDERRCIKSRRCTKAMPGVFIEGEPLTINLENDIDLDELIATINACPSGAISWEFATEKQEHHPKEDPRTVTVRCINNGPLVVSGPLRVKLSNGKTEIRDQASFCRCSNSSEMPFCDGSHDSCGYRS